MTQGQRLVHCNFGWEGSHDGYYYVGAFNTAKSPVTLGVSSTGPNDFSNDNEIMMYMLMRKTGLLAGFIALTLIVGCESDGCKFTYSKYYIENYVDGDLVCCRITLSGLRHRICLQPVSEGFRSFQ